MNEGKFLSIIYSGIKPGLLIDTEKDSCQILGLVADGGIEYLIGKPRREKISKDELTNIYKALSCGKVTTAEIHKIVGPSKESNANVIVKLLTMFGLILYEKEQLCIANWKLDSPWIFDEDVRLALLNKNGEIISTNVAWSTYALENGGSSELSNGIGINYLDVCGSAIGQYSDDAKCALEGIRSVIDGSLDIYSQHYTCHTLVEQQWYVMLAWEYAEKFVRISHSRLEYSESPN